MTNCEKWNKNLEIRNTYFIFTWLQSEPWISWDSSFVFIPRIKKNRRRKILNHFFLNSCLLIRNKVGYSINLVLEFPTLHSPCWTYCSINSFLLSNQILKSILKTPSWELLFDVFSDINLLKISENLSSQPHLVSNGQRDKYLNLLKSNKMRFSYVIEGLNTLCNFKVIKFLFTNWGYF